MRSVWNEFRDHRCASALFLLYWLAVFGLYLSRWNARKDTPDLMPPVRELHFLLPVVAGALVSWWRRCGPRRITGGMLAGAAVFAMDVLLILAYDPVLNRVWESSGWWWRGPDVEVFAFLIAFGAIGALLGLIGASATAVLTQALGPYQGPEAGSPCTPGPDNTATPGGTGAESAPLQLRGGTKSRGLRLLAGGLALNVAAAVALGVIPAVRIDTFPGATPERAATAFAVNAILNVVVGLALFVPVSRRASGAGKVMVAAAACVALLLGAALLDAGSAFAAHGHAMRSVVVTCLVCAAADLGAGVLALVAAFRRHEDKPGVAGAASSER